MFESSSDSDSSSSMIRRDVPLDAGGDGEKKHHHPFESEEEEDLFDALSPIYDQLKLAKPWWVLEFLPMKHRMQKEDGTWGRSYA